LEALNNIASNYDNTTTFLADMVLEPPRDSSNNMDAEDKDDEQLIISTIHSAKGLEWHSVFIMHAIDGFFPSSQSFDKQATIEEERRLMYVAEIFLSLIQQMFLIDTMDTQLQCLPDLLQTFQRLLPMNG
jgi:DNA helicase-2/ATP-dependent DNA helicase PcrA